MTGVLSFLGTLVEMDEEVLRRGPPKRCHLDPFVGSGRAELQLQIAASARGEWIDFEWASGATGGLRHVSTGLEVHPDTDPLGLMFALRGLFSMVLERQGGILVHASCVSWGGRAALVTGVSGAGKSTIARWATRAGGTLLSDEVVGLLPDGRVAGTPFNSDDDLHGTPTVAQLALVATLKHGQLEVFTDRPAHRLVEALCGQAFNREGQIPARTVLRTMSQAIMGIRTGEFTCRNGPEAGEALRELILASPTELPPG